MKGRATTQHKRTQRKRTQRKHKHKRKQYKTRKVQRGGSTFNREISKYAVIVNPLEID